MDSPQRSENDDEPTRSKSTKESKEKPALSPIEEETDSPHSSSDSTVNFHDNANVGTTKKSEYDLRVGLRNDYEEVVRALEREETPLRDKRRDDSPPFLTARNASDHDDANKYSDSSATTSYEINNEDDSSLAGESTSGDVDYCYEDDYDGNDLETVDNDDHGIIDKNAEESGNLFALSLNTRIKRRRAKSAPSRSFLDSSDSGRDEKYDEITSTLDRLNGRIVKFERDIFDLKKQLSVERTRGRKFARRYDDDRSVTRESLRIDLELWIKKLNDALKGYLAEWQMRERLRLNDEISRISDIYSQEIAKSLKINLRELRAEDMKNIWDTIERREKLRDDNDRINAKVVYERIQTHLDNLEKRNGKSYATLCKQIDKWEDRLRDEIVKLHEDDLKKLRQQVNSWYEAERKTNDEPGVNRQRSKERCSEMKGSSSYVGAEALLDVEENLLKRLRESSSKDLRRTEQIVRTELKTQRRDLAKRMNDKIDELWMAFEEFRGLPNTVDRGRSRIRNDAEECRRVIVGSRSKDRTSKPDVSAGRWIGGKILRSSRRGGSSSVSNSEIEDGDRDFGDDEEETTGESNGRKNILEPPIFSSPLLESASAKKKISFTNHSTNREEK